MSNEHNTNQSGAEIVFEGVTKAYPGQDEPAVDNLNLTIPAGELVAFVGPSGCGKTTSLKMINRLVEPSGGKILINGEDVTKKNPTELRRDIGYVIQGGGLLPHMSVADNIALVPKMKKWDEKKITKRTDELLDMVGLDPSIYRDRYPRELSGGQQQRVGVARGLAADPPVVLMDEPFGAVDPITRARLQDELVSIQSELGKTIVCVTHDIDEAMKLGHRILIFEPGAKISQYDTPENVLANPANNFVEDFIGSGSALKQLNLHRVSEMELIQPPKAYIGEDAADVVGRIPWSSWTTTTAHTSGTACARSSAWTPSSSRTSTWSRWSVHVPRFPMPCRPCSHPPTAAHWSPAAASSLACCLMTPSMATFASSMRRRLIVEKFKALKGENRYLIIGIPILVIVAVVGWLIWNANAAHDDIEARTLALNNVLVMTSEHLYVVIISAILVILTAVPLGVILTRPATKSLSPIVVGIANIGQAAPVIGVIVLLAIWLGFGETVAIAGLWFYAFLPVLANVIAGLRGVDSDLVEASRGLSMSPMQVLFKVELPLALPVIMTGIRTALVLLVGAGAFATFIDAGGLGGLITAGITLYRNSILISGALLIAALALAVEWLGRVLEVALTPKGMLS